MSWIVEDNPDVAEATAAPTQAKRSNAKRKKSAASLQTTQETSLSESTNEQNDTTEETKVLSKSQRKRARHQGAQNMTEEELNWSKISMFEVPDLPASNTKPISSKKANKKKADKSVKKGGKKSSDMGEIVAADYGMMDDWGWTAVSTEGMLMDDMEGFLGLEELDGVHVDFEGTDATGKTVVFKHDAKAASSKKGKNLKHSEPLSVADDDVYYDIDTFDEDVLMQQQENNTDVTMAEPDQQSITAPPKVEEEQLNSKAKKEKKEKPKKDTITEVKKKKENNDESNDDNETAETESKKSDGEAKKLTKKEKQRLKLEEFKAKKAEAKAAKASEKEVKKPYDPMEGVDTS
ncbi:hypothetical protein BGZ76_003712, partial [Entomortierella beljakovae]